MRKNSKLPKKQLPELTVIYGNDPDARKRVLRLWALLTANHIEDLNELNENASA